MVAFPSDFTCCSMYLVLVFLLAVPYSLHAETAKDEDQRNMHRSSVNWHNPWGEQRFNHNHFHHGGGWRKKWQSHSRPRPSKQHKTIISIVETFPWGHRVDKGFVKLEDYQRQNDVSVQKIKAPFEFHQHSSPDEDGRKVNKDTSATKKTKVGVLRTRPMQISAFNSKLEPNRAVDRSAVPIFDSFPFLNMFNEIRGVADKRFSKIHAHGPDKGHNGQRCKHHKITETKPADISNFNVKMNGKIHTPSFKPSATVDKVDKFDRTKIDPGVNSESGHVETKGKGFRSHQSSSNLTADAGTKVNKTVGDIETSTQGLNSRHINSSPQSSPRDIMTSQKDDNKNVNLPHIKVPRTSMRSDTQTMKPETHSYTTVKGMVDHDEGGNTDTNHNHEHRVKSIYPKTVVMTEMTEMTKGVEKASQQSIERKTKSEDVRRQTHKPNVNSVSDAKSPSNRQDNDGKKTVVRYVRDTSNGDPTNFVGIKDGKAGDSGTKNGSEKRHGDGKKVEGVFVVFKDGNVLKSDMPKTKSLLEGVRQDVNKSINQKSEVNGLWPNATNTTNQTKHNKEEKGKPGQHATQGAAKSSDKKNANGGKVGHPVTSVIIHSDNVASIPARRRHNFSKNAVGGLIALTVLVSFVVLVACTVARIRNEEPGIRRINSRTALYESHPFY